MGEWRCLLSAGDEWREDVPRDVTRDTDASVCLSSELHGTELNRRRHGAVLKHDPADIIAEYTTAA